ncbi:uncharacterized protein LOC135215112 [Macrobrachium nipponense]|uniref:uncharacterized protein LOC135215112 n=1 Tax=Macrobrachium nipponense TaxID=159736 RepID=UPI0030C86B0C
MSNSLSPELEDFEFVYPDECNAGVEDDWYLVDISSEEFPGHGTPPPSPNDSSKITEEDELILSYVSVLREGDGEEILTEWSSPAIFRQAKDDPLNPTAEVVGLTKDSSDTQDDPLNPTAEVVGLTKDNPFEFVQDEAFLFELSDCVDWDERSFREETPDDISLESHNLKDIYVMNWYQASRKCDVFGCRSRKRRRKNKYRFWR